MGKVRGIRRLDITENEEIGGFRIRSRRPEAQRFGPCCPIAHLIVVGGAWLQSCKRHLVASQRIAAGALHKGLDRGGSIHRSGTVECGIGGILYLCLCRRAIDLGKPGNALGSRFRHTVGEDTEGLAAVLSRSFADDHALVPGAAAADLFGIEGIFTRRDKGFGKCTLHAGAAQLLAAVTAHLIDIRTGNRLAVGIRYLQLGRHSDDGLLAGELIACRHGDDLFRTGEGISRSGFGIVRDSVAALRHRASQFAVRCGVLGDIDDEIAQLGNIVIIRVLRAGQQRQPGRRFCDRDLGKSLCQCVWIQRQRIIIAERLDRCASKILLDVANGAKVHRQFCLCDSLAGLVHDGKNILLADFRRLGLRQDVNGRPHPLRVLHAEGARLGGHIAVEVLQTDRERMRAVAEIYALEVKRTVVDLQLVGVVRAVQQHADAAGIDAGGILIGHLAVGVDGIKGKIAAVQHGGAVLCQRRAGGSLRDRFQHRPGNIVGIRAVDELEIIDVKIAGTLSAVLRRSYTNRIAAGYIHRHLERGDIGFYPDPALSCPVIERTAADCAVGIVTIILNICRRAVELLAVNIAYAAVLVKLHI